MLLMLYHSTHQKSYFSVFFFFSFVPVKVVRNMHQVMIRNLVKIMYDFVSMFSFQKVNIKSVSRNSQ